MVGRLCRNLLFKNWELLRPSDTKGVKRYTTENISKLLPK